MWFYGEKMDCSGVDRNGSGSRIRHRQAGKGIRRFHTNACFIGHTAQIHAYDIDGPDAENKAYFREWVNTVKKYRKPGSGEVIPKGYAPVRIIERPVFSRDPEIGARESCFIPEHGEYRESFLERLAARLGITR